MEKQRMEETAMEENKKTNPDSERKSKLVSAILMAFVCVLMMGGGTYAWFTMGNTARVKSLQLNVASEGNLYISKKDITSSTSKYSEVNWFGDDDDSTDTTTVQTLYPCTTSDGKTMKKPVYESDVKVSDVDDFDDENNEKESYVLEKDFYLYLDEGDGADTNAIYDVVLAQGVGLSDEVKADDGTYFIQNHDGSTNLNPANCVRMSFEVTAAGKAVADKTSVYEPNCDSQNTTGTQGKDFAENAISDFTPVSTTHYQKSDGNFAKKSDSSYTNIGDSEALFQIKGDTSTKVTIRVWFEGTDTDCRNDIELKNILSQIKFVANKTTTTATN